MLGSTCYLGTLSNNTATNDTVLQVKIPCRRLIANLGFFLVSFLFLVFLCLRSVWRKDPRFDCPFPESRIVYKSRSLFGYSLPLPRICLLFCQAKRGRPS